MSSSQILPQSPTDFSSTFLLSIKPFNEFLSEPFFNGQLKDQLNFDLNENVVGVLSAILTAFSLIFLSDIIFRVIVRASENETTSFTIFRWHVLQQSFRPLSWTPVRGRAQRTVERERSASMSSNTGRHPYFPTWARGLISAAGLFIIIADLLLIFMTTGRDSKYPLDMRIVQSLELKDRPVITPILSLEHLCVKKAIIDKQGFRSHGTVEVCGERGSVPIVGEALNVSREELSISVLQSKHKFVLRLNGAGPEISIAINIYIRLDFGPTYMSISKISASTARNVVRRQLRRGKVDILRHRSWKSNDTDSWADWEENVAIDLSNLKRSDDLGPFLKKMYPGFSEDTMKTDEFLLFRYVGSLVLGSLESSGTSRGISIGTGPDRFLDEYEGKVVSYERPWMSVGGCIALCAVMFVVWLFIVFGTGWRSSVDPRWAMKWKLAGIKEEDLREFAFESSASVSTQ